VEHKAHHSHLSSAEDKNVWSYTFTLPIYHNTKKYSKAVLLHAMEVLGGKRRYSFCSFLTSTLDGVSGHCHSLAVLYPWGKDPWYPLDRGLGVPQSWSGHRG
jgi:hypothetical protein